MKTWCVIVNGKKSCFNTLRYALAFAKAKRVYWCYTDSKILGTKVYAKCTKNTIMFETASGTYLTSRPWGNYFKDGRPMKRKFPKKMPIGRMVTNNKRQVNLSFFGRTNKNY